MTSVTTEGPCPQCGAEGARPIAYGFPDDSLMAAAERGEVTLGGCTIEPNAPDWRCRSCGAEWRIPATPAQRAGELSVALARLHRLRQDAAKGELGWTGHLVEHLWAIHDDLPDDAYPPGVIATRTHIHGTAAFPGGTGLVMDADGPLPPFPFCGVMVAAQDLDAADKYHERARTGRPHGDPRHPMAYWRSLYRIFAAAGLDTGRCFFTNVYVGLRTGSNPSGPFPGKADAAFVRWSKSFLELQAELMRPALVVFLGDDARKAFDLPGGVLTEVSMGTHTAAAVGLAHPSRHHLTARARRYKGLSGPEAEIALLADAVVAAGPSAEPGRGDSRRSAQLGPFRGPDAPDGGGHVEGVGRPPGPQPAAVAGPDQLRGAGAAVMPVEGVLGIADGGD